MNKLIPMLLTLVLGALLITGVAFGAAGDEVFVEDGDIDPAILSEGTNIDPSAVVLPPANGDTLEGVMETLKRTPSDLSLYNKAAQLFNQSKGQGFKVFSKGVLIDFSKYDNVMPTIVDGRTLIPVRALAESLGAVVTYEDSTREITIILNGKTIHLKLDSVQASVNGVPSTLEVPATTVGGRTMIPLRFVGEAFGKSVGWYPAGEVKVISITD